MQHFSATTPAPRAKCGWSIFVFLILFSVISFAVLNFETADITSNQLFSFQPWFFDSNNNGLNNKVSSRFATYMLELPWNEFAKSHSARNLTEIFSFYEKLFRHLLPYLVKPPNIPINASCIPPRTISAIEYNCTKLFYRPKIGILLQFGFDSDILEIYFREVCDIVENFFLIESTKSYFRGLSKPLLWPLLREQERFAFCKNKVIHFVIDDSDVAEEMKTFKNETIFTTNALELLQERKRWEKFLVWNNSTKVFKNGDLLGFGDSDEIPSRRNVEFLKTCKIPVDIVDIGIWFPFGRIYQAFKTDYPVPGHPFTYGDPAFWKFQAAMHPKQGVLPNRRRGSTGHYMLGGAHLTYYGYLPFLIVKMLSAIEQNSNSSTNIIDLPTRFRQESISAIEADLSKTPAVFKNRLKTLQDWKKENETEFKKIVIFPWFYDCNRDRYPMWEGRHDDRID